VVASGDVGSGAGPAGSDRAGVCRPGGASDRGGRPRVAGGRRHGPQVAAPVPGRAAGRSGRRAPAGTTAHHRCRSGGGGRGHHAGGDPEERHALVAQIDGRAQRPVEIHRRPDLAEVPAQAAPDGHLQTVHGPVVRGEGLRRGRAVLQPARGRGGPLSGREVPDPGAGPVPAGAADNARHARAAHPRLRPQRPDHPVRCLRCRHRRGHQLPAPTTPGGGVQDPLGPQHPGRTTKMPCSQPSATRFSAVRLQNGRSPHHRSVQGFQASTH
jgi:hypothetical protein